MVSGEIAVINTGVIALRVRRPRVHGKGCIHQGGGGDEYIRVWHPQCPSISALPMPICLRSRTQAINTLATAYIYPVHEP